jgi:hypothetical protein
MACYSPTCMRIAECEMTFLQLLASCFGNEIIVSCFNDLCLSFGFDLSKRLIDGVH